MWKRLSLRTRFFLPLGIMFMAALLIGVVSLQLFAPVQLADENEPGGRSAKVVADALNSALRTSANPEQTLDAFVQSLGTSEAIRFWPVGDEPPLRSPAEVRTPLGRVPQWFASLLGVPEIAVAHPVMIRERKVGDIIFSPDLSADIFEKWIGFIALATAGVALTVLTAIIAYVTAGAALGPLRDLGAGLTRMRLGDYDHPIAASGPPEVRRSAEEANALARTLGQLSQDNRTLLRKIVSLQDDERRDMARELHDELGPLLFGIRANTVALLDAIPPAEGELASSAQHVLLSVESLQQANRRILDRLRPLYIQELGPEKSIQTLLTNARAQAPALKVTSQIDPAINAIDGVLAQTAYRVIQEGITNVLRHAKARSMHVTGAIRQGQLAVEIADDGVGFPQHPAFGRGLTGMLERTRALSGTLELSREQGRTIVRCRLPLGEAAQAVNDAREA